MCKMSKSTAALFAAGLVGLACSSRSGLGLGGGGDGGLGGASGGQAGGGTGGILGGSGGAVGSGGLLTGGASGNQAGSGGISGAGGCIVPPCVLLDCLYGYVPSTSPCGCGECAPPPSAGGGAQGLGGSVSSGGALGLGGAVGFGGTGASGMGGTGSCSSTACSVPVPACIGGEVRPNPSDPCCPVCVLNTPDAGPTEDASLSDSNGTSCLPVTCPMLICRNGYQPSADPCSCPTCAPSDAGVAPSCDAVVCPSIPSSCTRIVQDPNACCPTCTDTGCASCPDLACGSGTHLETAVGACCPTCVPDPPDACTQGQQSYASMRASMLTKYSSGGCKNSSDCVLLLENNLCVWNCNIPLPSAMSSSFLSNLTSAAQSECATCAAPTASSCERMIPACVNGNCVAVNP